MTLHDPVEIKVTLSESVPDSIDALHLDDGSPAQIWFLDDLTPGLPRPLPLLAAGIIVRLRAKDDEDDSTVKLRPCRRSQLGLRWATKHKQDGWEHRLEDDWTGSRRVLAVSSVLTLPDGLVTRTTTAGTDLDALFDEHQRDFLDQCGDLKVNLSGLTLLGPITATKWKAVEIGDGLDVVAERWIVGELDFLELSIRVEAGRDADPEAAQVAFEGAVRGRGLDFDSRRAPKTEQVMTHLAAAAEPR